MRSDIGGPLVTQRRTDWATKFRLAQRRREKVKRRAHGMCERCGSKGFVCHHLSYQGFGDSDTSDEWPEGWDCDISFLAWLCFECHDLCHGREVKR